MKYIKINKRRVRERLKILRPVAITLLTKSRLLKASCAGILRRIPSLRRGLHLPASKIYSWEEMSKQKGNSEIPLDEALDVFKALPQTNEREVHWLYKNNQQAKIQRTFVASLQGGYAWGYNGGCFFSKDSNLIWDLGKEHWTNYGMFYAMTKLKFPKPAKIKGTVAILAHGDAYANWSHWLFDVVPKFGLLERAGFPPDKVDFYAVGHNNLSFQIESLERAGIPREKIIPFTPQSFLQADELIVPMLSTYHNTTHQKTAIDFIRSIAGIQSVFEEPQKPWAKEKLFISRSDASFRKLNQEEELRPVLEQMGFRFVSLTGMGIAETAALFSQAHIVAGAFGSGLMNVVFCRPGTKLVEIVCPSFFNVFHWYLSEACSIHHYYFMGNGSPVPEGGSMVDLTKDIDVKSDELIAFLSKVIEE